MVEHNMNIMAIAAHPDDIEINCAGTLLRYAKMGYNITLVPFTSGNMGHQTKLPEELAEVRKQEAQASAAVLGATLLWPAVTDECVFPDKQQRSLMIDLMRQVDPDIIITHSPTDYHPDHRYVSQLVFDSYFQKGLPFLPEQREAACRFAKTHVYFMDNLGGIDFIPTEYVDIADVFEQKKQMLSCHISQARSVNNPSNLPLLELIEIQGRFRGLAAGCRYAEGFRRMEGYQRGLTRRILP